MRPKTEQNYRERILRVLVHIQAHLDEPLSLDDLAAVARFSPYHFNRIFRGMVGESVKEHVRRLRLERAAHRLKHGDQPVTWVAFEAGYETHEAFTRAFGAMFGTPPSQFRELRRQPPGGTGGPGFTTTRRAGLTVFNPVAREVCLWTFASSRCRSCASPSCGTRGLTRKCAGRGRS